MSLNQKVVVLGASRYTFQDDSKKTIEGTKVHYISLNSENEENLLGHTPQTANMKYDYFDNLGEVPGIYDLHCELDLSKKKPTLAIKGFVFESALNLSAL